MKCMSCGKPTFSSVSDFCQRCMDSIGAAIVAREDVAEHFHQVDLFIDSVVEKIKPPSS